MIVEFEIGLGGVEVEGGEVEVDGVEDFGEVVEEVDLGEFGVGDFIVVVVDKIVWVVVIFVV